MPVSRPIPIRFWEKVNTSGTCWEWTARINTNGYGVFKASPYVQVIAHRMSYMLHHGLAAIPNGLFVCHTCDNPICVRPAHLFLGTPTDNVRDMIAKGRDRRPGQRAPRPPRRLAPPLVPVTHCHRGHPFDATNTYEYKGRRMCKTCRRWAARKWKDHGGERALLRDMETH